MAMQTVREYGVQPPLAPASLVDAVTWWLLTGEASPSDATRYVHEAPDDVRQRQHVADQVQRLFDAATAAGIGPSLEAVFSRLAQEHPTP